MKGEGDDMDEDEDEDEDSSCLGSRQCGILVIMVVCFRRCIRRATLGFEGSEHFLCLLMTFSI